MQRANERRSSRCFCEDNIANSFIQMFFGARLLSHRNRCCCWYALFAHCFARRNLHNEPFRIRFDYIICSNNHLIALRTDGTTDNNAAAARATFTLYFPFHSRALFPAFYALLNYFSMRKLFSKGLFLHSSQR